MHFPLDLQRLHFSEQLETCIVYIHVYVLGVVFLLLAFAATLL